MTRTLITALILSLSAITPARAGDIFPHGMALTYCSLRASGVSADQARTAAVSRHYSSSLSPSYVTLPNGSTVTVSAVLASRSIRELCPGY